MKLSHAFTLASLSLLTTLAGTAAENPPAPDPVFDLPKLLATPVDGKVTKATEKDGIILEEVLYHSEMDGDKRVDIFGILAYPKGARQLPAIVWCQGGLSAAGDYWPLFFAKRGYVALCPEYPMTGYRCTVGYPIGMDLPGDLAAPGDPHTSGIYHAAVALLKAVSFLETRPEVDKTRIGMAGSSWGGFFTTLMIGMDPRLKAGSCFFGAGNLQLGCGWWDASPELSAKRNAAYRETWRTTLDPAARLAARKTPIQWVTGTNDCFFWMPSVMQTLATAAGPAALGLLPNWNHGLTEEQDEQVFAWLDVHLQGKPAFLAVSPASIRNEGGKAVATWSFSGPRQAVAADLIWSPGEDSWVGRYWLTLPATIKDGRCSVELPRARVPYYVSGTVIDGQKFRFSTPLLRVDPAAHGLLDPKAVPACNGVVWGGFEPIDADHLRRNAWYCPPLADDAHGGKQAGLLKGKGTLSPIYYLPAMPQRLACWLKLKEAPPVKEGQAAAPVAVTLELVATVDGRRETATVQVPVKADWSEAVLAFTPPAARSGSLALNFMVPPGATVLIDDVRFTPTAQ